MNQITTSTRATPPKVSTKSDAELEAEAIAYLEAMEAKLNFKKTGYKPKHRRSKYAYRH